MTDADATSEEGKRGPPSQPTTLLSLPDAVLLGLILTNSASPTFRGNDVLKPLWFTCKKLAKAAGQHVQEIDIDDDKLARDIQRLSALEQADALVRFASRFPNVTRLRYFSSSGSTRALAMFASCALPHWKRLASLCMMGAPLDRHEWLLLISINCPHLRSLALITSLADYPKVTQHLHQWFAPLQVLKLTITKTSKETAAAGFALELKDMAFLTSLTLTIHVPAERKQNQRISLHLSGLVHLQHLAVLQQNPERHQAGGLEPDSGKIWGMELSLDGVQVPQIKSLAIYDLLLQIRLRELPVRFPLLESLHLHSVDAAYLRTNFQFITQLKSLKQLKLWPEPPAQLLAEWAKVNPGIEMSVEKPDW